MPIDDELLQSPINQHILTQETALLSTIFATLLSTGGQGWWHIVVPRSDGTWSAIRFSELDVVAQSIGPEVFSLSIQELPLALKRVSTIEQDSIDSDSARKLARESQGKMLVVTRQGKFAGILTAGAKRGGELFSGPTALELYGVLENLSEDMRLKYQAKAPPPICPQCGHVAYYKYDSEQQAFTCANCKRVIDILWRR